MLETLLILAVLALVVVLHKCWGSSIAAMLTDMHDGLNKRGDSRA